MEILIKDSNSSGFISVTIISREESEEWLVAETCFQLNGFNAAFGFSMMLGELVEFYRELKVFNETLNGAAQLKNIEDNINLAFTVDELGHVFVNGILQDKTYTIKTTFMLELDQTYLPSILNECQQILSELKVVLQ